MMAAMKNSTRPIAAVIPMNGTRMPTSNPRAPAAYLGHVDEDLLVANEIERGREGVRESSQNSDDDVGSKHY